MMRTDLRGHMVSKVLSCAQHIHYLFCGAVAQMKSRARLRCQQIIARCKHIYHRILNTRKAKTLAILVFIDHTAVHQRLILAVIQKRNIQLCEQMHRVSAQLRTHDGFSVLAEGDRPMRRHIFHVCQFLALHAYRDGSGLINVYRCHTLSFIQHIA